MDTEVSRRWRDVRREGFRDVAVLGRLWDVLDDVAEGDFGKSVGKVTWHPHALRMLLYGLKILNVNLFFSALIGLKRAGLYWATLLSTKSTLGVHFIKN